LLGEDEGAEKSRKKGRRENEERKEDYEWKVAGRFHKLIRIRM